MVEAGTPLMAELGGAGVAGAVAGFAAKILVKIFLFFVGIGVLILAYFEHRGFITLDWDNVGRWIVGLSPNTEITAGTLTHHFIGTFTSFLPAGAFTAGFVVGFKYG